MEYILIRKEKMKNSKSEDENIITIPLSPLGLIKRNFEEVKVNKVSNKDEEIFRSNWDGTFSINELEIIFSIKQYSKQKLSYLNISTKVNNIYNMELIDEKINKIMKDSYTVVTSYDCISEVYCNKIYRRLNNFERKLKELLFDIYTFHYGINYYDRSFNSNLKAKVKTDKSIYSESKSIEEIKQALYELDYNGIIELLFTPKWIADDEKDKLNLIRKINSDNLSSKELIDCIENIRPKSDWDRLFLPQIGEFLDIEQSIEQLRKLRNRVAHCKFFRKQHYQECVNLLKILNKQITKALKIVMNINFQELNAQYASDELHKALRPLQETLSSIRKSITSEMTEYINQIASVANSPMLKKYKESMVISAIDYRNANYKKIKGIKKTGE